LQCINQRLATVCQDFDSYSAAVLDYHPTADVMRCAMRSTAAISRRMNLTSQTTATSPHPVIGMTFSSTSNLTYLQVGNQTYSSCIPILFK